VAADYTAVNRYWKSSCGCVDIDTVHDGSRVTIDAEVIYGVFWIKSTDPKEFLINSTRIVDGIRVIGEIPFAVIFDLTRTEVHVN
jgi:hypothetical protein